MAIIRRAEGGIFTFFCPACECAHGVTNGWSFNFDFKKPTFTPSILVRGYTISPEGRAMIDRGEPVPPGMDEYPGTPTVCHSFVRDGNIEFLTDCTHKLAGKTVPLEDF
jgi:hypothetical protein